MLKLDSFAYTVNRMIKEREFKKKFAAFMMCVYDLQSGAVTLCPAGDNRLFYYDRSRSRMVEQKSLPGGVAAGQFSDKDLAEMNVGYPTTRHMLESGDVLMLITDGFDDARRFFRDNRGAVVKCETLGLKPNEEHLGTHLGNEDHERMSVGRILAILDAFFNKTAYRLERHHLAQPEELTFDFSSCSDSLEEAVLALVTVERVYRTYRDPQTSPKNYIEVETKVDAYLHKHFKQYEALFGPQAAPVAGQEKIRIPNIREDSQEDDLTVVLLRRP
jgi:hypothetical protein